MALRKPDSTVILPPLQTSVPSVHTNILKDMNGSPAITSDDISLNKHTLSYLVNSSNVPDQNLPEQNTHNTSSPNNTNSLTSTEVLPPPFSSEQNTHICKWDHCNQVFLDFESFEKHLYSHIEEKPFFCRWKDCTRVKPFPYVSSLRQHLTIHINNKKYYCTFPGCNFKAVFSWSLTKHQRVHNKKTTKGKQTSYKKHIDKRNKKDMEKSISLAIGNSSDTSSRSKIKPGFEGILSKTPILPRLNDLNNTNDAASDFSINSSSAPSQSPPILTIPPQINPPPNINSSTASMIIGYPYSYSFGISH